jgi:hypothetical protein
MGWGFLGVGDSQGGGLQLALALPFFEEVLESGWFAAERAAQAADKFGSEGLEDEAVFLFKEGDLGAFFDGVFAAELCRDDQLAFGGDGGEFSFHGGSGEWDAKKVYRGGRCKSILEMAYSASGVGK